MATPERRTGAERAFRASRKYSPPPALPVLTGNLYCKCGVFSPRGRHPSAFRSKEIMVPETAAPPSVLVIDDDPALLESSAGLLREFGYAVVRAGSAAEGLAALEG